MAVLVGLVSVNFAWPCLSNDLQMVMMLYNDEIMATSESEIKCKDNCV